MSSSSMVGGSSCRYTVFVPSTSAARATAFSRKDNVSSSLPPIYCHLPVDADICRSTCSPSICTTTGHVDMVILPVCPAKSLYGDEKNIDIKKHTKIKNCVLWVRYV
jgi:hypothetical protein